jgi:glucokinase-like ROK family protein
VLSLASKAVKAGRAQDLRLLGLGLSVPGTVDIEKGMLVYAPNLNWRNVSLKKIFAENTGLNVFIDNDANAAATAEHLFGKARRSLHFIFVFLGRGVGAGLFLNGELYRGRDGFAGEIGHSPIMSEPFYLRCQCGRYGCWETYANQQSIIRRVKERLDGKKDSLIPRLMAEKKEPLSVALIKQAADMGDALALDAFIDAGHAIGLGAASLINTYNPEMIVFGGPLSTVGDFILPAIKNSVGQHSDIEMSQQVDITFSEFGADASVKGAIAMVVDHILSNPTCISNK